MLIHKEGALERFNLTELSPDLNFVTLEACWVCSYSLSRHFFLIIIIIIFLFLGFSLAWLFSYATDKPCERLPKYKRPCQKETSARRVFSAAFYREFMSRTRQSPYAWSFQPPVRRATGCICLFSAAVAFVISYRCRRSTSMRFQALRSCVTARISWEREGGRDFSGIKLQHTGEIECNVHHILLCRVFAGTERIWQYGSLEGTLY